MRRRSARPAPTAHGLPTCSSVASDIGGGGTCIGDGKSFGGATGGGMIAGHTLGLADGGTGISTCRTESGGNATEGFKTGGKVDGIGVKDANKIFVGLSDSCEDGIDRRCDVLLLRAVFFPLLRALIS